MLQITPETENPTEADEKTDDAIFCAGCGHLVTRTRWKISMGGSEHVFNNPMGISFRIVCFTDAPGASAEGDSTDDHTWFAGYLWNFALCRGCGAHIGWHYRRDSGEGGGGDNFFGLIKNRLSSHPA